MSRSISERMWTDVGKLGANCIGQKVWVRGRVNTVRGKGKIAFLVLRQGCFTVQSVMAVDGGKNAVPKGLIGYASGLTNESIVDVFAEVWLHCLSI